MKKHLATLIVVVGLFACKPTPVASGTSPVASVPHVSTERAEYLQYSSPPVECTQMGGPVKHRSGYMGYDRYNCEESCKVELKKPPPCQRKNYRMVKELTSADISGLQPVSVGGFLFQNTALQPCSMKSKKCCESCSDYMALVDFRDEDTSINCRKIFFKNDDPVMMSLVSMSGGCCILEGLMEQVIVTGTIEVGGNWWTFTEVQSICSLSPQSQEQSP